MALEELLKESASSPTPPPPPPTTVHEQSLTVYPAQPASGHSMSQQPQAG